MKINNRRMNRENRQAEEHPVFQDKKWKQSQALAASEALALMPKKDHATAVSMVSGTSHPTR
jgi:hypothetical protein